VAGSASSLLGLIQFVIGGAVSPLVGVAGPTPHTGKTAGSGSSRPRAVGPERTVWSTDLGQVFNPAVEDGLPLMADRFLGAGFSEEEVRLMAVDNTRRVAAA
jgi:hypothetical protein